MAVQTIFYSYSLQLLQMFCCEIKLQTDDNDGPFGNFRKVAVREEVYDIIKRVHENDLVHSGILKPYKEVSLDLFTIALRLIVVG